MDRAQISGPENESVGNLRAIDKHSVHRICSGQVILDLTSAVKEVLENSLDAKATSIGTASLHMQHLNIYRGSLV
jgi:DNA mismatch repair protein PMS2